MRPHASKVAREWLYGNKDDSDDKTKQEEELLGPEVVKCPTDECIICTRSGRRPRKYRRIDSSRRHQIDLHFKHMANGAAIHCTLHFSKTDGGFDDRHHNVRHTNASILCRF
jgi:hypothetical protein